MSRSANIADSLRTILQSDDQRLTDEMRRVAEEYAGGCAEANDRLRRCMELLKRGLRSEAVHLAEAEPPVTDLVNELDLGVQQSAWDELCSMYDLPRAEPLRFELAEAVAEAYAELEPLNALLSRHRRLALGRAPLPMRIATLRDLVAADEQSPFWADDLLDYERARQREIEAEARVAAQAGDALHLQQLVSEVQSPEWREHPSKELQRKVMSFSGQVERIAARRELESLEPQLQSAFAALDLGTARHLRERWQDASLRARLTDGDPLSDQVAPVLGWLADEDHRAEQEESFERAVFNVERSLDRDDISLAELDRHAHAANRFDRELPAALVAAFRNKRASLEAHDRRKRFAIVSGSAVAVLIAIGLVGLLGWRAAQDQKIDSIASEISNLLDEGKLAEARRLFDENRDISAKDHWLSVRRSLEDAERKAEERQTKYIAAVEAATSAGTFADAHPHLQAARDTAASAEEKLAVARLEREWNEKRDAAYEVAEEGFRKTAESATASLARLEAATTSADTKQLMSLLSQAENAMGVLTPLAQAVRPEVAREREILAARLAALRSQVSERSEREKLLNSLTAALAGASGSTETVDRYVDAVEAYRQKMASDPRSAEFGEALAEADLWRSAVRWESLKSTWPQLRPDQSQVSARLTQVEGYRAAHGNTPSHDEVDTYTTFLQTLAARDGEEGVTSRLMDLFNAPLVGGPLYVVRTREGASYYLTAPADFSGSLAATFSHVIGTDTQRDVKSTLLKKSDLRIEKTEVAPQVAISESGRRELRKATVASWDAVLLAIAKNLFEQKEIDAFVQHLMLTEVLSAAAEGNSFLASELRPLQDRLANDHIDPAARWMDPNNTEAATSRRLAAAALKEITLADLESAWKVAAAAEQQFADEISMQRSLAGWLYRDGNRWELRGNTLARPGVMIVPIAAEGAGHWEKVGTVSGGVVTLNGSGLKQGRLAFSQASAGNTASGIPRVGAR